MTTSPISVYTDGSAIRNPGPGGWAFLYEEDNEYTLVSGGETKSTNNRMELTAVIEALEWLPGHNIHIVSDSLLTINAGKGDWKRKANLDLWDRFELARAGREITWEWVKAHSGNPLNDEVDEAARTEARLISEGAPS